ncbi:helix-turn-helix domain-containing protein [Stenotrophomonas indicatrix]|uniref:GlxA family transcriptional regulator n=1 Tax=Stenotrophomonas indicatrix TaxID=2045451 RepID=UPI00264F9661|nr:helix-turn-helix domain-containing protein [Stenotrophomonas indicatrix]MDN8643059.1 helix-turn-helix domain-containing protein [Stenotrophomonas indicatrix]MDN8653737.1 helix-turn-helix domain-containing protein [Stenotrophomonas indicatrix]
MADVPTIAQNQPMHDFVLVVPRAPFASSVTLTLDLLTTAAKLACRVGVAPPRWRVCAVTPGSIPLGNGLQLQVEKLPARSSAHECWILPGLDIDDARQLDARLGQPDIPPLVAALRRHASAGGTIAGSCSSVFLLNAAGLLDGRCVITTWWLASALRRAAPAARVEPDRMVHADGPVVTAGAAMAHMDLVLYVLRQRFGEQLTAMLGQALLVEQRRLQTLYMSPAMMAPENGLIALLTGHIADILPAPVTVDALAARANMSTRTLNRQVNKVLGYGPQQLIQSVRLNRARVMLESGRLSVEEVAAQVGLGDSTTLRRLLRRRLGLTPTQIRG